MAIVGSAEVVIRAIGDKLEGDIQRALNNAATKARPAGRKAGAEYGKGMGEGIEGNTGAFEDKIQTAVSGAMDRGSKEGGKSVNQNLTDSIGSTPAAAAAGDQIGRNIGNNVARGMNRSNMRRGVVASILKLGLLIPIVGIIVGGLSSLASGLFAIGAAAGSASQAMVSALGVVTAMVQAGGTLAIAFKGVGEAIKLGFDPTKAAEFQKALAKLPAPAREFVKEFVKLKPVFSDIKKEAQRGLFPELTKSLPGISRILEVFRANMRDSGKAVGEAIGSIVDSLSSATALENLNDIMKSNNVVIKDLGKGIGGLAKGFVALLSAARPLTEGLGRAFASFGENVGKTLEAKNATGELTRTLQSANAIFQIIWRSVKNFGAGLFAAGKLGKAAGVDLLKSFEGATQRFREFVEAPKNAGRIRDFFKNVGENVKKISSMFGELGKAFLRMGENPGIGKTADAIKAIIPNIERALNAGVNLGPKIAQLVGQIADLFTVLQESGALATVLDIFIAIGKVLVGFAKIPGVGIALQIMAIVFALRMLGRLGGKIGTGIAGNFVAMDRAVGRTRRSFTTMLHPMQAMHKQSTTLGQRFRASQTGMFLFGQSTQQAAGHLGTLQKASGQTTSKFGRVGTALKGLTGGLRGTGLAGGLAGGALLAAGGAAAASGGKFSKFSTTLTGAGIGTMILPGIGTAAGAAVGGLIDLGRHFLGTSDKAKKAAEGLKNYTANLKAMGDNVKASAGFADDFSFLDEIEKKLAFWRDKRHNQILMGADTSEADGKIKALEAQWGRTKAHIENTPPTLDAKLNFAETRIQATQLVNDIKNRMKELGGRKFKFAPFDTGPFQQESIALARSIQALTSQAVDAKNFSGLRSALVGMKGLLGINTQEAKFLANALAGVEEPLTGIAKPHKIKIDADLRRLFSQLGLGEEYIDRLRNNGAQPIKVAATFDVRDGGAEAKLSTLTARLKELEPTQMITLQTETGPVTRSVADVTAAIAAWRKQPADLTLGADGKPALQSASAVMAGIMAELGKIDPTVEVGAEKAPGMDGIFAQVAAAALRIPPERFIKLQAQKLPGFDGIIQGVLSSTGKIAATDVRALVGAKQGDMGAVGKVLQQAGIISKTQAKALVGAKQGDMSAIGKVLREAGLITKKEYRALVGAKKGNTADLGKLRNDIGAITKKPHEAKVGITKAKGGGFFSTVTDILKSVAPSKTQSVKVGVTANTAKAKGDISSLGRNMAIKIPTSANTGKAKADIAGLGKGKAVKVPVTANTSKASTSIKGLSRKNPVKVLVNALTGPASKAIAKVSRKSTVDIKTKADTKAQSAINKVSRKSTVNIKTKADGNAQAQINRIQGKTVSVYVKLTGPGANQLAGGGLVTGPGSGFADMVPAWLSAGEFVIRASQVRKHLALLKAINAGSGIPQRLMPAPLPVFDFTADTGATGAPTGGGTGMMNVIGVLHLADGKAYVTGIAKEQNASDTAYRNSLVRVGQNNT